MKKRILCIFTFLFLIFMILPIVSCGSAPISEDRISTLESDADGIAFLVFKMTKGSQSVKSDIKLLSKTQTTGKIKNIADKPNSNNYLTIEVFDNNTLFQTVFVNHPLYKTVEYADENNKLASKNVTLDEAEFFVRLQTKSGRTKVRIYETLKNTNKTIVATLKI